jgi:hypothetical protein
VDSACRHSGLINEVQLLLANLDVTVLAPEAVSVGLENTRSNTLATLVLAPVNEAWIGWKPRSRDVRREKAVFYAEVHQLYVPSAGVIEGTHYATIRPAQGELSELVFDVPSSATITDVNTVDPATSQPLPPTTSVVSCGVSTRTPAAARELEPGAGAAVRVAHTLASPNRTAAV